MNTPELFPDEFPSSAMFSKGRVYRYSLTRRWGLGPTAVFICLNPSTADETDDDPTVRRIRGFARDWGLDGATVLNIFALRSTDPAALKHHADPIGPRNDATILDYVARSQGPVVAAWGIHGALGDRGRTVAAMVAEALAPSQRHLMCLGVTAKGHPRHPLYLRADYPLERLN